MSIFKNIWKLIKRVLGFPPAPTAEQVNEVLITMREERDCHVAAVAVACGAALGRRVTYEEASKALWHWNLPLFLESPLLSNPLSLQRGIEKLGCKAKSVKISELLKGELPPSKVICLVHNPAGAVHGTLQSHWVVYMGQEENNQYLFHWGIKQSLRTLNQTDLVDMLTSGWPNCLILVESGS